MATTSSSTVCLSISAGFAGGWLLAHRALTSAPATAGIPISSPPPPPSHPRRRRRRPRRAAAGFARCRCSAAGSAILVPRRRGHDARQPRHRRGVALHASLRGRAGAARRAAAVERGVGRAAAPRRRVWRGAVPIRQGVGAVQVAARQPRQAHPLPPGGRVFAARARAPRGGSRAAHRLRDVIFQRDPFTIDADAARPLDVFMEDYLRNYSNSGINRQHVAVLWRGGGEARAAVARARRLVLRRDARLARRGASVPRRDVGEIRQPRYSPGCLQHDQAFHNWLLWTGGWVPACARSPTRRARHLDWLAAAFVPRPDGPRAQPAWRRRPPSTSTTAASGCRAPSAGGTRWSKTQSPRRATWRRSTRRPPSPNSPRVGIGRARVRASGRRRDKEASYCTVYQKL